MLNDLRESARSIRILLVEDDAGDARLIEEMLREYIDPEAELVHAGTLRDAITRIVGDSFDAIVLDLGLPDSQGSGTLIRVLELAPEAAVVVLTGLDDVELGEKLLHAGAQDYLVKGEVDGRGLQKSIRFAVERVRVSVALREAKNLAEAASDAKSRFMAVMSHELRTPLNAVIGYSEILAETAEEDGNEDLLPDLHKIRDAGKQLLAMVNDVLDLSTIDSGKASIACSRYELRDIVNGVAAAVRPQVESGGNQLTVRAEEPVDVSGDPERLRQVLMHLLSNAAKFTENGTVELSAAAMSGADCGDILCRVRDTGIGIDPALVDEIFEPFTQADNSVTRRYGGTGLGLTIARRLCALMGGTIGVESHPGRGSTFTVRLPRYSAGTAWESAR